MCTLQIIVSGDDSGLIDPLRLHVEALYPGVLFAMSYQVLARKWRPRTFSDVVGQAHVLRALTHALDRGPLHHAYLFTGTRGVGKTTIARILAKCFNCESGVTSTPCGKCGACLEIDEGRLIDLIEVDAASRAKVDETRELMENVQYAPSRSRYKVYIIDEVHMFSKHSFNALLKTLEEPPPHAKFLLATTEPQKLPVTVLSRCLQFNLKRLPVDQIATQLSRIASEEGVTADSVATRLLAEAADGSLRDALSLLDQAIAFGEGRLVAEDMRTMLGTLENEHVQSLLEALASGNARTMMVRIGEIASAAPDFSEVLGALLSELQRIAVAQIVPEAIEVEDDAREAIVSLAKRMSPEEVQLYYQIGLVGRRDLALAPDPRGGFEMTMLRMFAFRPHEGCEPHNEESAPSKSSLGPPITTQPQSTSRDSADGAEQSTGETGAGRNSESDSSAAITGASWPIVVERLNLGGLARQLAANTVFKAHDGDSVHLRLDPAYAQLASDKACEKLQDALRSFSNSTLRLRIDIGGHDDQTPAGIARRRSEERHREAIEAIENDPNVKAICETFGAQVRKDRIQSKS